MGENSHIAWTHHTFNPWWGCARVSPGCTNCYAEQLAVVRRKLPVWGVNAGRKSMSEAYWRQPIKWNRDAERAGERRRVFCASMADVFEITRPLTNPGAHNTQRAARFRLWDVIAATPWLDWLLLTKRPENVSQLAPWAPWGPLPWPSNVWLGVTAEDQKRADERIPILLSIPARVRFVSYEPALGPVDFSRWMGERDAQAIREHGSRSGPTRGVGDRSGRVHLESRGETGEPLDAGDSRNRLPSKARGEATPVRLHDRAGDVQREASHGLGASARVASPPRPDPDGDDRQPSERGEGRQPPGEPEPRHVLRADDARDSRAGVRPHPEPSISWVIVGGESGSKARPFDLAWARSTVRQCREAGVACFVKQMGARAMAYDLGDTSPFRLADPKGGDPSEWPEDLRVREFPR